MYISRGVRFVNDSFDLRENAAHIRIRNAFQKYHSFKQIILDQQESSTIVKDFKTVHRSLTRVVYGNRKFNSIRNHFKIG